jgi:predicted DCC family thiol-disulfide oxidoreductase YuxK
MLYKHVSPQTLGFARIWVFSLWMRNIWNDPVRVLSEVPISMFDPPWVVRIVPSPLHSFLLTPTFLVTLKVVLLVLMPILILGIRPYRVWSGIAAVLLLLYTGIIQSFGPVIHGEIAILLAAVALAAFPAGDAFAVHGKRSGFASPETYQAGMLSISLAFMLAYAWIGIRRIAGSGPGIFFDNTILRYVLVRSFEDSAHMSTMGQWAVREPLAAFSLQAGFIVTTILEALSPLILFYRPLRIVWLVIIVPFHFLTREMMRIFFFWNLMLMPVFLIDLDRLFAPRLPQRQILPTLFFDGECGLCNRFVRWLMRRDVLGIFRVAPLQGETARTQGVKLTGEPHAWSLVLVDEAGTHEGSEATLRAIGRLGAGWNAARLLLFVPRVIRDTVYRWIAQNRYRWFGRVESCALLTESERNRLLP